jgi:hypothetical protein
MITATVSDGFRVLEQSGYEIKSLILVVMRLDNALERNVGMIE